MSESEWTHSRKVSSAIRPIGVNLLTSTPRSDWMIGVV